MKKHVTLFLFCFAWLLTSCNKDSVSISVENKNDFDWDEAIVEIPMTNLLKLNATSDDVIAVFDKNRKQIISQRTYNDKLIFQTNVKANQTNNYTISKIDKEKQKVFESKAYANIHPDRKNDFAWENDCVGFRFYAAELEPIDGPSNGLDLWYKRTNKIVLDNWYKDELSGVASYHVDRGQGCDPYLVGRTLGAGNIAPLEDGKTILNKNYTSFEYMDNGPLHTQFRLNYPDFEVNGETMSEYKIITLDAGSQLTKIEQHFGNKQTMDVAVGFVKRNGKDSVHYSNKNNYLVYEEPQLGNNGTIYLGAIIPSGIDSVFTESYAYTNPVHGGKSNHSHVLISTQAETNKPIVYYTGFGWNKASFENVEEFKTYMQVFAKKLEQPLIIRIRK